MRILLHVLRPENDIIVILMMVRATKKEILLAFRNLVKLNTDTGVSDDYLLDLLYLLYCFIL